MGVIDNLPLSASFAPGRDRCVGDAEDGGADATAY
jgi:hypothetical protein